MTEVAIVESPAEEETIEAEVIPTANMAVVARNPQEMVAAQASLIAFCDAKLGQIDEEERELTEAIEHHQKRKWSTKALARVKSGLGDRRMFYGKMKAAMLAGYYIVPDFPADVFAIRTTVKMPNRHGWGATSEDALETLHGHPVKAMMLPEGRGEYQSPRVRAGFTYKPDPNRETWAVDAANFRKIEFPYALAVPEVVEAAKTAMALKLFDELAVSPQRPAKQSAQAQIADPIMLGRIIRPWDRYGRNRAAAFLIAWWLDPNTL